MMNGKSVPTPRQRGPFSLEQLGVKETLARLYR